MQAVTVLLTSQRVVECHATTATLGTLLWQPQNAIILQTAFQAHCSMLNRHTWLLGSDHLYCARVDACARAPATLRDSCICSQTMAAKTETSLAAAPTQASRLNTLADRRLPPYATRATIAQRLPPDRSRRLAVKKPQHSF